MPPLKIATFNKLRVRSVLAVLVAIANGPGCAHQERGSALEILRRLPASLPACRSVDPPPLDVGVALGRWWMPGEHAVVRGYLSVVSMGPPCDPHVVPGGAAHCGALWTLWDSASHPVEFDLGPTGALTLAARSAAAVDDSPLPALPEPIDAAKARPGFEDLNVTIAGSIPEHLCAPKADVLFELPVGEKCNGILNAEGQCEMCAQRWLTEHALNVQTVCRNTEPAR